MFIVIYTVARLFAGADWPPGFATIIFINLLNLSIIGLLFGVFGAYLGRTYSQTKDRPLSIIDESVGKRVEDPAIRKHVLDMSSRVMNIL